MPKRIVRRRMGDVVDGCCNHHDQQIHLEKLRVGGFEPSLKAMLKGKRLIELAFFSGSPRKKKDMDV